VTLGIDNGTDGQTDRQTQTDGRTDRVRCNMRPPPREEGRIITVNLTPLPVAVTIYCQATEFRCLMVN